MPDCPNPDCQTFSGERTQIASDANYCINCGIPITSDAKDRQNVMDLYVLNKINDLKNVNKKLNDELSDKNNKIKVLKEKNIYLTAKVENKNNENVILISRISYYVFCLIGVVFLLFIIIYSHE